MKDEAERIAKGLSVPMREALILICTLGNDPYGREALSFARTGAVAAALARRGLLVGGNIYGARTRSYRFTDRGLAVRRALAAGEAGEGVGG